MQKVYPSRRLGPAELISVSIGEIDEIIVLAILFYLHL
jgi:hypothetical protein